MPIEDQPIHGLVFLDGDVLAERYRQDWSRGKKSPLIAFPSGTTRELLLGEPTANIVLFGDLMLPHRVTLKQAVTVLANQPHPLQIRIQQADEPLLVVLNRQTRRGYRLSFDRDSGELSNLTHMPEYAMELLPGELRAVLPPLYSQEKLGGRAVAPIKFFTPDSQWSWYPTEFDGNDILFGLVSGLEVELGYFSVSELESVRGGLGLPVERDLYYEPHTIDELREYHNRINRY